MYGTYYTSPTEDPRGPFVFQSHHFSPLPTLQEALCPVTEVAVFVFLCLLASPPGVSVADPNRDPAIPRVVSFLRAWGLGPEPPPGI